MSDKQIYLISKKSDCKDCYKCIRNCPVKAITFEYNQAQIISDECILCGNCYVACPQEAKEVLDTRKQVAEAIRSGKRVIASVAPSFIAAFDVNSIEDMRDALVKLGFSDARETAVGAEMISREYEKLLGISNGKPVISSACPSINSLIQKYYPDLISNLAAVVTPMHAHCRAIKSENPDCFTVFIGPCIAKKRETDESDCVDACLTFDEVKKWFIENDVNVKPRSDAGDGTRSRYYPTTGGIIKSMNAVSGYDCVAIDGVENCMAALEEIRNGEITNVFIEMSACQGSCVNGPIMREHAKKRLNGVTSINKYAGSSDFNITTGAKLDTRFEKAGLRRVLPGNEAIQAVLSKMGKTTPDKELNCGSCGYPTCRDKAIAVCQGKADISMCLPFLKEKAESFSDKIIANTPNAVIVMDEDLTVQQINSAAVKMFNLRSPDDILRAPVVRLLNPADYMQVVQTGRNIVNKCHYIAEYKIFVEETMLYDKQYKILISIMRDVTEREKSREQDTQMKEQTINTTNAVIEKQMRVVQEITSLLGETTAETKIALTKLKDAMMNGK